MSCHSCKNTTSNDRCSHERLVGSLFCGIHSKLKKKRIWADVNNVHPKVILIQKIWRGYSVRNYLSLCGPRTMCRNTEEIVSLEEKIYPLDYFSFEEAGSVYWFDVRSLFDYISTNPTNPYTRQPLSLDVRRRLRKICILRIIRKWPVRYQTVRTQTEITESNWNHISRIMEENGFYDMNSLYFTSLNDIQLHYFLRLILTDLTAWASHHTCRYSRRLKYIFWIRNCIQHHSNSHSVSSNLLKILHDAKDPYELCFIIMASRHRL
jgi:hypothetical protein